MKIKQLKQKDLIIGKPSPWHVYDKTGRLMLKEGVAVQSEAQLRKLLSIGAFIHVEEAVQVEVEKLSVNDALSPFHHIEETVERLNKLYRDIIYKPADEKKKYGERFFDISKHIVELCEYDLDATLGSIHLGKKTHYTLVHPLYCAIISYVLAFHSGIRDRRVNSIICAALTSNLGMFELQGELVKQNGPLTDEQRIEVEKHTMRSTILLRRNGVVDKLWIEIVLQHHEKLDGTGYPRKLKGSKFIREARMLGLADRYHAMIAPRQYREGLSPTDALKEIFKSRGAEVDESLGSILIKEMGIYPPGAIVKLINNETAIVTRRGKDRMRPIVKSIMTSAGNRYEQPMKRDTRDKGYKIMGLCQPKLDSEWDLPSLWDYL